MSPSFLPDLKSFLPLPSYMETFLSLYRLKFEGDGVPVSRHTSMCLLNVALLDGSRIFSPKGRSILGCVEGQESYLLWKICFAEIISFINALELEKTFSVDGAVYEVEVFLGGDLKWLLCVCGLNAANSSYACLWCHVHKVRGGGSKIGEKEKKDSGRKEERKRK